MRFKLKLEEWGPRKQWILTDRDIGECIICSKLVNEGVYCPKSDKFWCEDCEKNEKGRSVCNCTFPYHESFKVLCRKDKKNVQKQDEEEQEEE